MKTMKTMKHVSPKEAPITLKTIRNFLDNSYLVVLG